MLARRRGQERDDRQVGRQARRRKEERGASGGGGGGRELIASFRAEARGTGALLLDTGARDGLLRCDPGALTDRLRERGGAAGFFFFFDRPAQCVRWEGCPARTHFARAHSLRATADPRLFWCTARARSLAVLENRFGNEPLVDPKDKHYAKPGAECGIRNLVTTSSESFPEAFRDLGLGLLLAQHCKFL